MKFLLVCVALAGILTSTNGCKKDSSATDGTSVASGTTGTIGNASVQTLNFSIENTNWTENAASRLWVVEYFLPYSGIENGSLRLYMLLGSKWVALPYINEGITYQFGYTPSTKMIEIQAVEPRIKTVTANSGNMSFRTTGNMSFRATWVQMQLHSPESKPKAQTLSSNFLFNWKEARKNC